MPQKLNKNKVDEIKKLMIHGIPRIKIAAIVGVSTSAVDRYCQEVLQKNIVEDSIKARNIHGEDKNPFRAAQNISVKNGGASEHFKTRHNILYYKGAVVRGMKDWDAIIKEMNGRRIELGLAQFNGKPDWVHLV